MVVKKGNGFIVLACLVTNAFGALAYIDPGTGGVIAGSIWPFILAILAAIGAFFARYFWKPVKRRASKVWKKIKKK